MMVGILSKAAGCNQRVCLVFTGIASETMG